MSEIAVFYTQITRIKSMAPACHLMQRPPKREIRRAASLF